VSKAPGKPALAPPSAARRGGDARFISYDGFRATSTFMPTTPTTASVTSPFLGVS